MSERVRQVPADAGPKVMAAVELALTDGVITRLMLGGEPVAAIGPIPVLAALQDGEDARDVVEADAAMDEGGRSTDWETVRFELDPQPPGGPHGA